MSNYRPYPKYKPSGVEWLGDVPDHWLTVAVTHIFAMGRGRVISHEDILDNPGPYPVYSSQTENGGEMGCISTYDFEGDYITWTTDGANAGTVFKRAGKFNCTNVCGTLKPKNDKLVDTGFVAPALDIATAEYVRHDINPKLMNNVMGSIRFALPPLPEQYQIAAFLDRECGKLDALQAKQERLIELLKEKRQALISHAVTRGLDPTAKLKPSGIEWLGEVPEHWRVGKCGFYLSILSGFAFPSAGFSQDESQTKLLRGINVGVSRTKWDDIVYWQRTENDGLGCYELRAGDLVVGMDRPWISEGVRVAKIKEEDLPCLLLQRVTSLKTNSLLLTDYLYRFLSSEMFVAYFTPDTTGVSVPHISPDQICDFVIPIPPLAEQRAIVAHLDEKCGKIDQLKAKAERGIELLKERRSALISAAVTGKIDVRES